MDVVRTNIRALNETEKGRPDGRTFLSYLQLWEPLKGVKKKERGASPLIAAPIKCSDGPNELSEE